MTPLDNQPHRHWLPHRFHTSPPEEYFGAFAPGLPGAAGAYLGFPGGAHRLPWLHDMSDVGPL